MSSTSDLVAPGAAGQSITLELPAPKSSKMVRLVGVVFWMVLVYMVCQLIQVYTDNQAIIGWWQQGTGPTKRYNQHFSIWLAVIHENASALLEFGLRLFLPGPARMSASQLTFVTERLFAFLRLTVDGKQLGILIPRHIGEGVLLQYTDGDDRFNQWCDTNKNPPRMWNPADALDPKFLMTAQQVNNSPTGTQQFKWQFVDGKVGIYPGPSDTMGWKCCIQYWMNGENTPNWLWTKASDPDNFYAMKSQDPNVKNSEWWDVDKHPDNVFARYGISYDAPVVVYFANGFFADKSLQVDPTAMQNLLLGGWARFLYDLGPNKSVDDIYNMIATSVNFQFASRQAPSCGSQWGGSALAVGGTFVGSLGSLLFPGVAEAFSGMGGWLVLGFALVSAAVTAGQQVVKNAAAPCK